MDALTRAGVHVVKSPPTWAHKCERHWDDEHGADVCDYQAGCVERRLAGKILARIEEAGFTVRAMRLQHLTRKEAEGFYAVHRERPFFGELTEFHVIRPVCVACPRGARRDRKWRDTMGPTDPSKAAPGSLRRDFGESIGRNATHGSDARRPRRSNLVIFSAGWS
jgi:nucleoside-diphosphate kinase